MEVLADRRRACPVLDAADRLRCFRHRLAPDRFPLARMFQPVVHFLERFGNVVGRLLLTIVYVVAVAPVAIIYRLCADPLGIKHTPASTYHEWQSINDTLEDARRQD